MKSYQGAGGSGLTKWLMTLCLVMGAARPGQSAETRPSLSFGFAAGQARIVLTGTPGAVYAIQLSTDLSNPNPWVDRTLLQARATNLVWTDPFALSISQRFYRAVFVPAPADTNLVFIEPGTFTMGSPKTEQDRIPNESPQTVVTLSRGFWMGKYSVTQGQYQAVVGFNPSYFAPDNGYSPDLTRPVEQVTWENASNYCAVLTQQDLATGRIPTNCGYRLPTEAEYEYSYRAGTTTRFPYGDDPGYTSLTNYEWFGVNSGSMTHPVGQKLPNPWGLFDLAGNVATWCHDWHAPLPGGSVIDPQGPDQGVPDQSGTGSPPFHVIRVNSWEGGSYSSRCAFRSYFNDGSGEGGLGIRLVLGLSQ